MLSPTRPRRARRAGTVVVLLLIAVVVAAACGGSGNDAKRGARATDNSKALGGRDLVKYLEQPGDQVITLPDGTYRGGDVHAPHKATNGRYGGWLVLKAASQHGVVVDLAGRELRLDEQTSRVAFVGFKFVNGSVRALGHDIAFWYSDHTFPADEWLKQAPNPNHPERGYYRAPRTVYANERSVRNVGFYGSDFHDAATAITISDSNGVLLQGVHIWRLGDGGVDPQDAVHADAIGGVGGGSEDLTVKDTWIQGRVVLKDSANGDGGGPHENFLFEDVWVSDSPSSAFIFTSIKHDDPRGIFGVLRNVRMWDSNNGNDRVEIIDDETSSRPNTNQQRIDVRENNVSHDAPPDGTPSPADTWRRNHPYDSWPRNLPFDVKTPDAAPGTTGGSNGGGGTPWVLAGIVLVVVVLAGLVWRGRRRRRRPGPPEPPEYRDPVRDDSVRV
jgi:hypothetical protein